MNILNFATASTGDAKTGHSLNRHLDSGPETGFIDRIKSGVKNKIEAYKAQARGARDTRLVLQMSDTELKDIGLTSTDRDSLELGLTSLSILNTRRETYRRKFY